jgi:hypothetical protein
MIYTCYEMIRDCREDRAQGWRYFAASYVPLVQKLLARYQPSAPEGRLESVLASVRSPQSGLFHSLDPAPERWFIAQLRQEVLATLPAAEPAIALDLETVAGAWQPLTLVEKQAAWLETMRYTPAEAAVLLRMAPSTAEKIRGKAADLLRGAVDSWNKSLLADNGLLLGRAAAAASGADCLPPKPFLDMMDGRTTWRGREELEQHVTSCWHCIDHFCRLAEVVELLRANRPLPEEEAAAFRKMLNIADEKRPVWKRWMEGK